jgi:hypothetical protein
MSVSVILLLYLEQNKGSSSGAIDKALDYSVILSVG